MINLPYPLIHVQRRLRKVLGFKYPYLSAIRVLMYITNNTRLDIAFAVNLLVRYSVAPTMCHWNGVKDVLLYL
jgi:hypothetical protein